MESRDFLPRLSSKRSTAAAALIPSAEIISLIAFISTFRRLNHCASLFLSFTLVNTRHLRSPCAEISDSIDGFPWIPTFHSSHATLTVVIWRFILYWRIVVLAGVAGGRVDWSGGKCWSGGSCGKVWSGGSCGIEWSVERGGCCYCSSPAISTGYIGGRTEDWVESSSSRLEWKNSVVICWPGGHIPEFDWAKKFSAVWPYWWES